MIMFETLTTEEIKYICGQIPLSLSRQYFQKNPKGFAEIKPGFRPERLSDADTFSLLSRYANKPFIASFLEKMITKWLDEIQENRHRLVDEGYSEEEALLLTIPESVFCDNCELYFKLIENNPNPDYIRLFQEALSLRQKESDARIAEKKVEQVNKGEELLKEANKTITDLKEQLNQCKISEASLIEELDLANNQVRAQKEEFDRLKSAFEEGEAVRSEMQDELDHYRRLASFSDEYIQDDTSEYQHTSIGQIYHDHKGQTRINRLADIIDGEIVPFVLDDSASRCFNNRDRLYWKDGPDEDGVIGVWNWRADPKPSDPMMDYVKTEYSHYLKVTEVVELPQCKSISEISSFLTDWFENNTSLEKVLYVYVTSSGAREGVLCYSENMENHGDKIRLLASVFMLPHYSINPSDIIKIGQIQIYRKMSLGIPQSIVRVRTPYDVVKKMILSRLTVSALREIELTKKEAQRCKRFLESIPTETLIQEISDAYLCTESEAKGYVDGFIEHADTYLTENDLDINVISQALERNKDLVELCKKLLTEEWEKDYSDKISEAQKALLNVEQTEMMARQETEALLQRKEEINGEIQALQHKVEKTNQLAVDVEKEVAERIKGAQKNAAEFISQMSFIAPFISSSNASEVSHRNSSVPVFRSKMSYTDEGIVDDIDTFEEELVENLVKTGYSKKISVEMAQTISFCICSRIPIVVGENSTKVAQCVAATIGGEELTELFVANQLTVIEYLSGLMEEKRHDYPFVYLIHGVFDGYNNNLFNEISNVICRTTVKSVVILSLQGIAPNMVNNSIWSGAFYIDGDAGLKTITNASVHAFEPVMEFVREVDADEYKKKRNELQLFSSLLSNTQMCLYAKYLASYGISIENSPTILNQIIAVSRSEGTEEILMTLFRENGISTGEKMIERRSAK